MTTLTTRPADTRRSQATHPASTHPARTQPAEALRSRASRRAGWTTRLARIVGPASVAAACVALAGQWIATGPGTTDWGSYLGELIGAESVLLMALALVLAAIVPLVESWFGGLDRAILWHRHLAVAGMLLLIPHVAIASSRISNTSSLLANVSIWGLVGLVVWALVPRLWRMVPQAMQKLAAASAARLTMPLTTVHGDAATFATGRTARPAATWAIRAWRLVSRYQIWRTLHRLTGVLVAIGFLHGLDTDTLAGSAALRNSYLAIGAAGLAAYLYQELVRPVVRRGRPYRVEAVSTVALGMTELSLAPVGRPMRFRAGQFARVRLATQRSSGRGAHHEWHPFTIASGSGDRRLTFTIGARGDLTDAIPSTTRVGDTVRIDGPHGRFTGHKGTEEQIWIAAGVGITPFLSRLRSLDETLPQSTVHLFYSAAGPAPYADEIMDIANRHCGVTVHLVDSRRDGRLTANDVLRRTPGTRADQSVFLCGPRPMVVAFARALRRAGIPRHRIHHEHFGW